jgi:hypothetical protein
MIESGGLCREKFRLRAEYILRLAEFNRDVSAWIAGTIPGRHVLRVRQAAARAAWSRYLAHVESHGCRYGCRQFAPAAAPAFHVRAS